MERFYLYQNNSDDDWESVLRPYADAGVVDVTTWPMSAPAQWPAYAHFVERHYGLDEWAAFIDCDEFLFSPRYRTVAEVLEQDPFRTWGAVGVNWMCFGSSGHERRTEGLVIERFIHRPADTFGINGFVKCIVRMDRVESVGPNAHQFNVAGGTFGERGNAISHTYSAPPSHEWLRVNHYATKSREEFLRRISYSRVDMPCSRHPNEFDLYQPRDVDDREIWRFLPEIKARLAPQ